MRIHVGRLKTHLAGTFQLRPYFLLHFICGGIFYNILNFGPQGTFGINQAGYGGFTAQWAPTVIIPFRGKGKVESRVYFGVFFQLVYKTWNPTTGHHYAYGVGYALRQGLDGTFIGIPGHAGIIYVHDQHFGTFGPAQAFGIRGIGLGR